MSLDKIFGLYTLGFLLVTILIGVAEYAFGLTPKWIGWIYMALSLGIYVFIGILTRTSNPDQYYVAGRGVPSIYNGMATGSDWMSAASFISMAGLISTLGFFGITLPFTQAAVTVAVAFVASPTHGLLGQRLRRHPQHAGVSPAVDPPTGHQHG